MSNSKRRVSLGFDHYDICEGEHICLLFRDESERQRIVSKFLSSGMTAKEKLLYLVDTMTPDEFIGVMESYGVNLRDYAADMDLLQADPVYCPDGHFSSDRMIDTLDDYCVQAQAEKYVGLRGTGEMT